MRLVFAIVTTCKREFALLVVAGDLDPLACAAYRFFCNYVHLWAPVVRHNVQRMTVTLPMVDNQIKGSEQLFF